MNLLVALIAACLAEKSDAWGPDGKEPLRAETVASGLEVPWSFAFLSGGDVLVSERPGRVRLLHQGKLQQQTTDNRTPQNSATALGHRPSDQQAPSLAQHEMQRCRGSGFGGHGRILSLALLCGRSGDVGPAAWRYLIVMSYGVAEAAPCSAPNITLPLWI